MNNLIKKHRDEMVAASLALPSLADMCMKSAHTILAATYEQPPVPTTGRAFVYSIKFNGTTPVGAVAVVAASNAEDALRRFKSYMFMNYNYLYIHNKELTLEAVTVFCQAHDKQIGRVEVLLDGEY
jgi:hypothetical protein